MFQHAKGHPLRVVCYCTSGDSFCWLFSWNVSIVLPEGWNISQWYHASIKWCFKNICVRSSAFIWCRPRICIRLWR